MGMSVLVCSLFSPLLSSRLVLTGLHLSIKNLMMRKLLLDLSGSPRLTSARMLLHKRSLARPTLLPGKTLLLLRRKLVVWIIGNVKKSITTAQEDAALKKCISDLKGLSA